MQASAGSLARVRPAIDALTSVRFFAAFYVAIFHWAIPHPHRGWPTPVRNAALAGYIGVPMFFVLSGFILSYNYAPDEQGRVDRRGFWVARFARIYPVYLLGLAIAVPFFLKDLSKAGALDPGHVGLIGGTATTLTQAWSPATACKWNCPGWTLSVEAFFYALFPFLLAPLLLLPVRRLLTLSAVSWVIALLGPTYVALGLPAHGKLDFYVSMTPISRLPEFVIGMALGLVFLRITITDRKEVPRGAATLAAAAATLALAGLILTSSRIPEVLLRTSLVTPLFAVIICALALNTGSFAAVDELARSRAARGSKLRPVHHPPACAVIPRPRHAKHRRPFDQRGHRVRGPVPRRCRRGLDHPPPRLRAARAPSHTPACRHANRAPGRRFASGYTIVTKA